MSLHVQTQARRSRMSQSPSMVRTSVQNASMSTTPVPSPTHTSTVFADLMVALPAADEKTANRDIGISLPPLNVNIYLYQGFAIWWMLRQERTQATGGFVGDEMGLEKVYITLTIIK